VNIHIKLSTTRLFSGLVRHELSVWGGEVRRKQVEKERVLETRFSRDSENKSPEKYNGQEHEAKKKREIDGRKNRKQSTKKQ